MAMNHWQVIITGRDEAGAVVARFVLPHGADPAAELAERGWRVLGGQEVLQEEQTLTVVLIVAPTPPTPASELRSVPVEDGLTRAEIEAALPYQRVAAYGFVETERGLLLTELSERTWTPGQWTLPGGGIDPGESALAALRREVWEETDQQIEEERFLGVLTSHWIGRSPGGRIEDFHAVRLYFRCRCPAPTAAVVHDVDGSTASAAWIPREDLAATPLTRSLTPALERWLDG
ncbi:MAG: NUDIX domain-containing protein [Actinomycetia bacterium]|nr:NUDIX domain-containing protein [Actinomycetes bacterium]